MNFLPPHRRLYNQLIYTALEKTARFGRDPFALLIVFIAGLGTAHILVRTATYGAAVTLGTRQ